MQLPTLTPIKEYAIAYSLIKNPQLAWIQASNSNWKFNSSQLTNHVGWKFWFQSTANAVSLNLMLKHITSSYDNNQSPLLQLASFFKDSLDVIMNTKIFEFKSDIASDDTTSEPDAVILNHLKQFFSQYGKRLKSMYISPIAFNYENLILSNLASVGLHQKPHFRKTPKLEFDLNVITLPVHVI